MTRFEKARIAIRYQLLGMAHSDPSWYDALKAFDFAESYSENSFRKDGAPEFSHQIRIASSILQVHQMLNDPAKCVAVAFLHDILEDKPVGSLNFESQISEACSILNKNVWENTNSYYLAIGKNKIASIVKGFDRLDNVSTMYGAFSPQKIESYIKETEDYVLPMLKTARHTFYNQSHVYELIRDRIENITAVHKAYLTKNLD